MAEAGAGKSRLVYEFETTSQSEWTVLETVTPSHEKRSSLLPIVELLTSYFRIEPSDEPQRRREKITGTRYFR